MTNSAINHLTALFNLGTIYTDISKSHNTWTANEPPGSPGGLDNFANTTKKKPTTRADDNQLKCSNGPGDVYASISHRKSCAAIPCPSAAHLLSRYLIGCRISGEGIRQITCRDILWSNHRCYSPTTRG